MSAPTDVNEARASTRTEGDALVVELDGHWRVTGPRPRWRDVIGEQKPSRVKVVFTMDGCDSAALLFASEVRQWCRGRDVFCDVAALPESAQKLLDKLCAVQATEAPFDRSRDFLTFVGMASQDVFRKGREVSTFVGECVLSALYLMKRPDKFRWRDCLEEMQQCGAMALPIVSLISFLIGVTLAYTGAIVLRQYGGDIYVADLVGLGMVREMGAMMTAVVLAGRTGAAFAARLGNMKANEEIDALETLGIRSVDFLVIPRLVALFLMMPLLALYANCLGILGGVAIARGVLDIPPTAFWVEMLTIVDLSDITTGVIKAATFGLIVGLAGCLRGLQADRSAVGVGQAATSAVVTALLFIIVFDALFAVIFDLLGV